MASFNTISDAVNAAVKIQEICHSVNDFQLRIGIHAGEVVFENNDLFGDCVNIAARIQAAAMPGTIFISEAINQNLQNKREIRTQFVKEEILKNVNHPVKMYQVMISHSNTKIQANPLESVVENSIAILPFTNMSRDPEQEYFSDGISEEIINVLAQVPNMKVIGRTSSFAFKGKNQDLREIGKLLAVQYLLEGSVRKSGNKLRITAQLIESKNGFHLYSEKFDRELEDIFAIQDEIALSILSAIKIKLLGDQNNVAFNKSTTNLDAYQLFLHGRYWFNKYHPDAFLKAIENYNSAVETDPQYAIAYAEMASCYQDLAYFNWLPRNQCLPQAIAAANKALELDDQCAESNISAGRIKIWIEWDFSEGYNRILEGNRINPNHVEGLRQLGFYHILMGNVSQAHDYIRKAEEVDPFSMLNLSYLGMYFAWEGNSAKLLEYAKKLEDLDPNYFGSLQLAGMAYNIQRKYDQSIPLLEKAIQLNPDMLTSELLGVAYARHGEIAKARNILKKMKDMTLAGEGNIHIGNVYTALKDWNKAFEYFNKAVDQHEAPALTLRIGQFLFPELLDDPRYHDLAEKIGIPILSHAK